MSAIFDAFVSRMSLQKMLGHLLLAAYMSASAVSHANAGQSKSVQSKSGALVLVGDVLSFRERTLWKRLFELAGGEGADVVVISAAHGRPRLYGGYAVRALERFGPFVELLPLAETSAAFDRAFSEVVRDPEIVARVKQARIVFFVGGAPQRLARVLFTDNGSPTPLAIAIKQVYEAGGVIVGGILARAGPHTGVDALDLLRRGRLTVSQLYRGLGLMGADWYVDQHLFSPGRLAEALVAMHQLSFSHGIGVGPNTIAVVKDGQIEIAGRAGAMILSVSAAKTQLGKDGLSMKGASLSYLEDGDRIALTSPIVLPHADKLNGFDVDPNSPDHKPRINHRPVVGDLFAPDRPLGLLLGALESDARESIGLALAREGDRSVAKSVSTSAGRGGGFRFRFYTGSDTYGWLSLESGRERYSVQNIYLDVEPISRQNAADLQQCEPRPAVNSIHAKDGSNAKC